MKKETYDVVWVDGNTRIRGIGGVVNGDKLTLNKQQFSDLKAHVKECSQDLNKQPTGE